MAGGGATTLDVVHRTHLEIFDYYYPPILSDWWMDDWITHVYGTRRFTKGPFSVRHHTGAHGQRYAVDNAHKAALRGELQRGRQRWESQVPIAYRQLEFRRPNLQHRIRSLLHRRAGVERSQRDSEASDLHLLRSLSGTRLHRVQKTPHYYQFPNRSN